LNCVGLTKIDTTTSSQSEAARRISDRCPSCRNPMVGTRPIRRPGWRADPTTWRSSATVFTTCIGHLLPNISAASQLRSGMTDELQALSPLRPGPAELDAVY
jgi:hypothetical protein